MSWLLPALLVIGGCAASPEKSSEPPVTKTITNCGTPVAVKAPPAKAVTMNQSATEIMLALGLQDRMAGTAYLDDAVSPEYADAYAKVPVLAKEYPSKEKLLETAPDFVYASFNSAFGDEGVGDRAEWQKLDVGTYISPAGCPKGTQPAKLSIDDVFGEIRDIGMIFGVSDRAEALITAQKARLTKAPTNAKVLWWDGGSDAPSVGACCGAPGMIMEAAGVTNAFADVKGSWGDTSWEAVAERNPDVIVLIDASWDPAAKKREFLEKNATLKGLPAVKAKKYVVIPFSETSAGVRNVQAVESLVKAIS
ncbi:ABC transporter substrate-binding protein [Actinoplanes sp. TRM 88003]|uniref:ABC transporter substrate-binding protein n=1 Tax=Paractinoplanes aksuensis TaxID=2939490 RepID=A0ABT1DEL5_9ACTN|nr:ABC transporter substrate-binding protein [Actinoplanes aksuensis]MCO8269262.1 ABC transporter substrate-binding protein [Actinoplanes aksuensis]